MRGRQALVFGSTALIGLLGVGVGSAAGSGAHPAVQRPAAHKTSRFFLDSSTIKVKGTGGVPLHLAVSGSGIPGGTSSTVTVTLSTGAADGVGETHSWTFLLSKTGVTYNSKTGRGHITSNKKLGSFGVLRLNFKRTSQHTSKCDRGTPPNDINSDVAGRLSGVVFFNTHSHAWGSVGSRKHAIRFTGHSHLTSLGSGCPIGFQTTPVCVKEISWFGPFATGSATFTGIATTSGSKSSTITVSNNVTLSKPAGASRSDYLVAKEPAPTVHGKDLEITTSGKTITGSASINNSTSSPNNFACKHGSTMKQEKGKYHSGTWGSTSLTATFQLTGKFETATGTASYTVESY